MIQECKEKIWEGNFDLIEYNPPSLDSFNPFVDLFLKPKFIPKLEVLDIIEKGVGKIEYEGERQSNKKERKPCVQNGISFKSRVEATAITNAGNNMVWVGSYLKNEICMYDDKGQEIKSLAFPRDIGINDMTVKESGEIIIVNTDQQVQLVSLSGTIETLVNTSPFTAMGVCLSETEEIAVCMRGQGYKNHIAIYSQKGSKKMCEIRGRKKITDPYRIVCNGHDFSVVNSENSVITVDREGKIRWSYRPINFYPKGIACDIHQNTFVSDFRNSCVHQLDENGYLIRMLLTHEETGLNNHWAIYVDRKTGYLWVGNNNGDVVLSKNTYLK